MRTAGLVVAILLGIAAAVGARTYLKSQQRAFQEQHKMVEVAVAAHSITAGETLTEDMVAFEEKPAGSQSAEDIPRLSIGRYLGRKATGNIDRGSQILVRHFVAPSSRMASTMLVEGRRALTIAVDATSGVAGLIHPGDHVDIHATSAPDRGAGAEPETWLVLSDVTVLAVDDRMSEVPLGLTDYSGYRRGYSNLTFALTPLEAQLLTYLKDRARLTFSLRPKTELGQKTPMPSVNSGNVQDLARQANLERQKELQELETSRPEQ